MEYKRKVTSQQEGIEGYDQEFGKLKLQAKSKRLMPLILAGVSLFLAAGIFCSGIIDFSTNIFALAIGIGLILFTLIQISFMLDTIRFYEYGLVDATFLTLRKKRIAYDDIDAIVETRSRFLGKDSKKVVALWTIVGKNGKKITIDGTSYIGISNILMTVRQNTKIKNIA